MSANPDDLLPVALVVTDDMEFGEPVLFDGQPVHGVGLVEGE